MKTTKNPDLLRERQNASFNPEEVTHFLDGGPEATAHRRQLLTAALSDPIDGVEKDRTCMSDEQAYDDAVRVNCAAELRTRQLGLRKLILGQDTVQTFADAAAYVNYATGNDTQPFGLHFSMFMSSILSQGTDEQIRKWLPDVMGLKIIGTYAQTELGHGTHIRGLETTATYDPSAQQFVLHSPTLTATKFWPGSLGKTANHAVVMAQLYTGRVCHGVHPFMVQLRSLADHSSMPGVTLGVIGSKFGYKVVDNGFARFDHYRIPRENMLMKTAQVSVDGAYTRTGIPQLTYMSMVLIRSLMAFMAGNLLGQAATIAIRYSAVRRQSAVGDGIEPQVIDYQTQQLKLFPCLAEAYAYIMAGKAVRDLFRSVYKSVESGDASGLEELHVLAACMKASSSDVCSASMETLRTACGGHGYSAASNFNILYDRCVAIVTYEGENTVMYLQTARALVKYYNRAQENGGTHLPPLCTYLASGAGPSGRAVGAPGSSGVAGGGRPSLDELAAKIRGRARWVVAAAVDEMHAQVAAGRSPEQAWNAASILLVKAAKAHAEQFVAGYFVDALLPGRGLAGELADSAARLAVSRLAELYVVGVVLKQGGDYLLAGLLSDAQLTMLERRQRELLGLIRPDAVALVDAFDYRDELLRSALGRYDGDVYEALYKFARDAPLNKTDVHPSYFKYIQPLQKALAKL